MNNTKIVLFNAPPGSGKDECVDILIKSYPGSVKKQFKDELFSATCEHFKVTMEWFMAHYSRELKEKPLHELGGRSPREALIHVSEDVYKPEYGDNVWGIMAANNIEKGKLNIFADCGGWDEELQPIVDKFGEENILIIQLARHGCGFKISNDSRMYLGKPKVVYFDPSIDKLSPDDFKKTKFRDIEIKLLYNNGKLGKLFHSVETAIDIWLESKEED